MASGRTKSGTFEKGAVANPHGRGGKKMRKDGWGSTLSGIGDINYDKRMSFDFTPTDLTYEKCIQIFESDDFGKKAARGPVNDAFRPGYQISITDEGSYGDLKTDLEDRLRKLKVNKVIKQALSQKRALGGSAILLGVRDNKTMDRPLDREKAKKIDFLTNLEPMDLTPYAMYDDPTDEKYGEVKLWELRNSATIGTLMGYSKATKTSATQKQEKSKRLIHESRLIIFNNEKISNYSTTQNPAGPYWGLSIYTLIIEILRDFNIGWASAGLVISDFSQAVFSIEGLMQMVIRDENGLRDRMRAMNMGRSTARAILIDTAEKFERQSIDVNGLPEMLNALSRRFAASIDTPLSVLMGGGEKSDQAEMGDDLRYYYDSLEVMQVEEIDPVLRLIAEIEMRGLRERKRPKHWGFKWNELWKLTDEQRANARLAQARVDAIYIKHGVLDPQTVAQARFSGEYSFETPLPPSFKAPGFMVLPPMGVVVDGKDPKTGLPPGVLPPDPKGKGSGAGETGSHGVGSYSRRNPRQTSMAGSDTTAGGDTAGQVDGYPEDKDGDLEHDSAHPCGQRHCTVCQ